MNEYYVLNCKAPYAFVIVADSYNSCKAHTQKKISTYRNIPQMQITPLPRQDLPLAFRNHCKEQLYDLNFTSYVTGNSERLHPAGGEL